MENYNVESSVEEGSLEDRQDEVVSRLKRGSFVDALRPCVSWDVTNEKLKEVYHNCRNFQPADGIKAGWDGQFDHLWERLQEHATHWTKEEFKAEWERRANEQ